MNDLRMGGLARAWLSFTGNVTEMPESASGTEQTSQQASDSTDNQQGPTFITPHGVY